MHRQNLVILFISNLGCIESKYPKRRISKNAIDTSGLQTCDKEEIERNGTPKIYEVCESFSSGDLNDSVRNLKDNRMLRPPTASFPAANSQQRISASDKNERKGSRSKVALKPGRSLMDC